MKVTIVGSGNVGAAFGKAWGGHCLPKDTQVFLDYANSINFNMSILKSVIKINNTMAKKKGIRKEHWSAIHSKTS